jgi:hypothetical protein
MKSVVALLNLFVDICLFRKGPQDVPASAILVGLAGAVYWLVGFSVLRMNSPPGISVGQTTVELLLMVALLLLALALRGVTARLPQTFIAMAGTGTLLTLIAWPLVAWALRQQHDVAAAQIPGLLLLLLILWSLAVTAHILRHALEIRLPVAVLLSVTYLGISMAVSTILLPRMA